MKAELTLGQAQVYRVLNHNTSDSDEPLTLEEACRLVFRDNITPATLRAEHARGNLVLEKIGRRQFVTRAAINEMRIRCRVGPTEKDQGSGSSQSAETPMAATKARDGSSAMVPSSAAQDALQMTLQALRRRSPSTSRKSMIHAEMSDSLATF